MRELTAAEVTQVTGGYLGFSSRASFYDFAEYVGKGAAIGAAGGIFFGVAGVFYGAAIGAIAGAAYYAIEYTLELYHLY